MENETNGVKRPYAKPEIKQVALRPDEAVLGACKASTGTGGGPGGVPAISLCVSIALSR